MHPAFKFCDVRPGRVVGLGLLHVRIALVNRCLDRLLLRLTRGPGQRVRGMTAVMDRVGPVARNREILVVQRLTATRGQLRLTQPGLAQARGLRLRDRPVATTIRASHTAADVAVPATRRTRHLVTIVIVAVLSEPAAQQRRLADGSSRLAQPYPGASHQHSLSVRGFLRLKLERAKPQATLKKLGGRLDILRAYLVRVTPPVQILNSLAQQASDARQRSQLLQTFGAPQKEPEGFAELAANLKAGHATHP